MRRAKFGENASLQGTFCVGRRCHRMPQPAAWTGGKMRHLSIWLVASFVVINVISGYVNGGAVVAGIRTMSDRRPMTKIVHLQPAAERTALLKVHE